MIQTSKNAFVYKRLDWLTSYHVIIKTDIHICMNVSFTLVLACNRNDFMIGQLRIMWRKSRTMIGIPVTSNMPLPRTETLALQAAVA